MVVNANEVKSELLVRNEMHGLVLEIRDDPHPTLIDHFLRRFNLDELLQLRTVLKGDMSPVGARLSLSVQTERFTYWQR